MSHVRPSRLLVCVLVALSALLVVPATAGALDYTPPLITVQLDPDVPNNGAWTQGDPPWSNRSVFLEIVAYDPESGVTKTEYAFGETFSWALGPKLSVVASPTHENDGVWEVWTRATNGDGVTGWYPGEDIVLHAYYSEVRIDTTPPATTTNAPAGWSRGPVSFTLTPADATSGVAATKFSIDGRAVQSGTTGTVGDRRKGCPDGIHTVAYYSIDAAGNVEATKTVQVKIDATPPMTFSDAPATAAGSRTVHLYPFDGRGSGLSGGSAGTWYRIDGGAWTAGKTFTVSGLGTHTLEFYSVDSVGNVEPVRAAAVRITSTAIHQQRQVGRSR